MIYFQTFYFNKHFLVNKLYITQDNKKILIFYTLKSYYKYRIFHGYVCNLYCYYFNKAHLNNPLKVIIGTFFKTT